MTSFHYLYSRPHFIPSPKSNRFFTHKSSENVVLHVLHDCHHTLCVDILLKMNVILVMRERTTVSNIHTRIKQWNIKWLSFSIDVVLPTRLQVKALVLSLYINMVALWFLPLFCCLFVHMRRIL